MYSLINVDRNYSYGNALGGRKDEENIFGSDNGNAVFSGLRFSRIQ